MDAESPTSSTGHYGRSKRKQSGYSGEHTDGLHLPSFLNPNNYATKKSLAQGMLDLALLSANAAQLKFIITNWDHQEFNVLLLSLVAVSICLQVLQAIVCIVLGLIFDINEVDHQKSADIINNVSLAIAVVVVAINVVISVFDIKNLAVGGKTFL